MKLKLDDAGHVVVSDGKPVYLADDGKEIIFDYPATLQTIGRLNGEAKAHRTAKEAAEAKLVGFEGIEDPAAALKALELVKNIDDGKLLSAGKVEEIKVAARKAAEDQVAAANKANAEAVKNAEAKAAKLETELFGEKIGGSFTRSKLIADKFAIPADLVQSRFGQHFKVEDGKIVAYDSSGNKVFSRARAGELADFDEALETLVDQYPYKDSILKGTGNRGDGKTQNNGSNGSGGKTMSRAAFDALSAADKSAKMRDGYQLND